MKRTSSVFLILLVAASLVSGCSGRRRESPILRLSAAEALEMGKAFLEEGKYYKARQHLTHAFEVEPNSRSGREALLLAADALYLHGGSENFIRCEAKYRDFLNRFPTSDRADYAQFRVGECLARRVEKADRDQKVTHSALQAFEELLRLYPTSQFIPQAHTRIREVSDRLADHELTIGNFYTRYYGGRFCLAAIERFELIQREYPSFSRMDEVLFRLVSSYEKCQRPDDAAGAFDALHRDFPDSPYLDQLAKDKKGATRQNESS